MLIGHSPQFKHTTGRLRLEQRPPAPLHGGATRRPRTAYGRRPGRPSAPSPSRRVRFPDCCRSGNGPCRLHSPSEPCFLASHSSALATAASVSRRHHRATALPWPHPCGRRGPGSHPVRSMGPHRAGDRSPLRRAARAASRRRSVGRGVVLDRLGRRLAVMVAISDVLRARSAVGDRFRVVSGRVIGIILGGGDRHRRAGLFSGMIGGERHVERKPPRPLLADHDQRQQQEHEHVQGEAGGERLAFAHPGIDALRAAAARQAAPAWHEPRPRRVTGRWLVAVCPGHPADERGARLRGAAWLEPSTVAVSLLIPCKMRDPAHPGLLFRRATPIIQARVRGRYTGCERPPHTVPACRNVMSRGGAAR